MAAERRPAKRRCSSGSSRTEIEVGITRAQI
jgi:hypothetical protein